jgi:hypothetical protein
MARSRLQPAEKLSALLAAAVFVQSAGGLFLKGLYRDNTWVVSIFRGTDWVTLLLVLPVLLASLAGTRRGSPRARLVWLGTVGYVFYNNVYYLLCAFNRFFLIYVIIFVLASWALAAGLMSPETRRAGGLFDRDRPRKGVVAVLLANAAILAVMWIGQSLLFVGNGRVPQIIADSGGTTHMVAIFDLTLIVPFFILAGVWLWKGRAWGYILSAVMLVACVFITTVLVVSPPFQAAAGVPKAYALVPLWGLMGVSFLASAIHLFGGLKLASTPGGG